jgi:hypothetical protein
MYVAKPSLGDDTIKTALREIGCEVFLIRFKVLIAWMIYTYFPPSPRHSQIA